MGNLRARRIRQQMVANGLHLTPAQYRKLKKASASSAVHNKRSGAKEAKQIVAHQLDLKERQKRRDERRKKLNE